MHSIEKYFRQMKTLNSHICSDFKSKEIGRHLQDIVPVSIKSLEKQNRTIFAHFELVFDKRINGIHYYCIRVFWRLNADDTNMYKQFFKNSVLIHFPKCPPNLSRQIFVANIFLGNKIFKNAFVAS